MEIAPVSIEQVRVGRDGRQYEVSGQAGRIVQRLRELDPTLRVQFHEGGMFFAIQQVVDAGGEATELETDTTQRKCVGTVPVGQWDDRVIREWEMRAHELRHGRSAADRLDGGDDRRRAASEYELEQTAMERAYPLFRSFQRATLGINPRIYLGARKRFRGTS